MKKQLVLLGIAIMLVAMGLSGCEQIGTSTEEDEFVGTWKSEHASLIFYFNGTCSINTSLGTYSIKDERLVIVLDTVGGSTVLTFTYEFDDDSDTLTLTDIVTGRVEKYIEYYVIS